MSITNYGSLTVAQIEALNGRDMEVGLIQEVQTAAPEIATIPARVIKGTQFKATRITGLPTGGGFRQMNGGIKTGAPNLAQQKTECENYSRLVKIDPQTLNAGEDDSEDQLKAMQQALELKAAFIYLGVQTYYGTANDTVGFPGLGTMINPALTLDAAKYNSVNLTAAANGTLNTVFAVKFGPQNVHYVYGKDKAIQFSEWYKALVADPTDPTKSLSNWVSQLDIFVGLANGSQYSVGAIFDLNVSPGINGANYVGLNDNMFAELEALYPVGNRPDAYFMSRQVRKSLQLSRSKVTIATGARTSSGVEIIAPIPTTTMEGIPIIVTDSIQDIANPGKFLNAVL